MSTQATKGPPRTWKIFGIFVAGSLLGALSAVEILPNFTGAVAADGTVLDGIDGYDAGSGDLVGTGGEIPVDAGPGSGPGKGPGSGPGSGTGSTTTGPGGGPGGAGPADEGEVLPGGRPGLECAAGKNGGETDRGVSDSSIKMATTVAESGPGAAFLGEVRLGMEAVVQQVNAAGGICGRTLDIEYRDDGWNAQTGAQYLRNFIQSGIFAIPVGPSSEGLRVIIDSGDIDRSQVPVVGTDGMLLNQYVRGDGSAQPWVWPVAAATVSSARIMVQEAYRRGARDFSIVFDSNYRFGVEAAAAYNAEVKRLTGKDVPGYNSSNSCRDQYCGVIAGRSSYSTEVSAFNEGDFVALFLEPQTALAWMGDANTPTASQIKYGYGAAQPLFTRGFAVNCQEKCDGMSVWTGFKPPIESYVDDPAVKTYVEALKRTSPSADEFNAFTEGGYLGMQLLVDALKRVGPDLTLERLKIALDSSSLRSGLTLQSAIPFSPQTRFANTTMQAFAIQYKGTFGGWREGPIVRDK